MTVVTICYDSDYLGTPMQLIRRDEAGNDLDVLDIHGPDYGGQGVTLLEGYEGFYHQDATVVREPTAYRRGSTPTDIPRINERILTFTLGTQARTPDEWEAVENRLWKFWSFDWDCVIRLHSHRSEPREIKVRKERKPRDLLKRGPGLIKSAAWQIVALACDPDWQSEELSFSIKRSQMTDIGGGVYEGFLPMQNPADQPCYPIYVSNQLTTSTTVSLPDRETGRLVPLPTLTPGREFLVRTDPLLQTLLTRDQSLQWAKMNARAFDPEPIRGGLVEPVMVPVRIQGGTPDTEITMYLPQRWERCFGGEA